MPLQFNEETHSLIHSHYARLYAPPIFTLFTGGLIDTNEWEELEYTSDTFTLISFFPSMEDDVLLFLSFMGGKRSYPFKIKSQRVPWLKFWQVIKRDVSSLENKYEFGNIIQKGNDGKKFEAIVCSVLCASSHMNGFEGIPFKNFLKEMVYELQV